VPGYVTRRADGGPLTGLWVSLSFLPPLTPFPFAPHRGRNGVFLGCFLVGSSRVDLQACKLEYSIVSPK